MFKGDYNWKRIMNWISNPILFSTRPNPIDVPNSYRVDFLMSGFSSRRLYQYFLQERAKRFSDENNQWWIQRVAWWAAFPPEQRIWICSTGRIWNFMFFKGLKMHYLASRTVEIPPAEKYLNSTSKITIHGDAK